MELTEDQAKQEVQSIRSEEIWPLWPVLPMKNIHRGEPDYPQDRTHGLMFAPEFTKVWIMSLFELKAGLIRPQLEGRECLEFASTEALVAAGWVAD